MDTFSLIVADRVLKAGGIRDAARALACPSSTAAAAFARLENGLAIRLAERTGSRLVLTLEGRRLSGGLALAARTAESIEAFVRREAADETSRPPSLPLLTLRRFVLVARAGSIRRAAQEIGIGQPQLSRQMSGFEAAMGMPLFRRSVEGIELTASGMALLGLAEELTGIWQTLSNKAADRFRKTFSTIRLGAIMPLGPESATARLLAKLAAYWPSSGNRAPLFISSTTAQELLMGLQKGSYDLAILDTFGTEGKLDSRAISRSPLVLVAHRRYFEQFGEDIVKLLTHVPLAAASLRSGLRQKFEEVLHRYLSPAEREAAPILEIDSLPAIANLVLDYGYAALLPKSALDSLPKNLHVWKIGGEFDLELTLVWPPTPPARRAAEQVLAILMEREFDI